MVRIPYRAVTKLMLSLMPDEVQMVFVLIFIALQHIKRGGRAAEAWWCWRDLLPTSRTNLR